MRGFSSNKEKKDIQFSFMGIISLGLETSFILDSQWISVISQGHL